MKFTVKSSNPNQKGGFVTTINRKTTVDTIFGTKEKSETYYVSGSKQLAVDQEIDINLSDWKIQEHTMKNPETGEEYQGKWLHL
jgi:hypothetical protein